MEFETRDSSTQMKSGYEMQPFDKSKVENDGRLGSICDSGLGDSIRSNFINSLTSLKSNNELSLDALNGSTATTEIDETFDQMTIEESEESVTDEDIRVETAELFKRLENRTVEQKLADIERCEAIDHPHRKPRKPITVDENYVNDGCIPVPEECDLPKAFQPDQDGDTMCHLVIVHKYVKSAFAIIESAKSWKMLDESNLLGQTPLHLAVLTDQAMVCRKLLAHGATLVKRDRHGNTPLHLACKYGFLQCVLALTKHLTHQEVQSVPYCIPFQCIPQRQDLQNYEGETCIQLAAAESHINILQHLFKECQANLNAADWKSGRTLLHQAVESNNMPLVELLLGCYDQINVNAQTYEGYTPLQLAKGRNHFDIVQLLMVSGALDGVPAADEDCSSDEDEKMVVQNDSDVDDGFDDYDDIEFCGQPFR